MKTISPVELQKILTAQPGAAVIDVRTPVEYAEVHVPAAQSVPLDELKPGSLPLPKDQPVYLLCRSGQRATKAAEKLAKEGFTQPVVIEGGTLAWIEANLPVTRSAVKVMSLERQVRIVAGAIVFTGVLLARFVDPRFIWLSGFVGAGLVFAGVSDFCGMGLLLARMPWNKRRSS
ncbi:MAG TPA: rhodanese-like domain-containing protein [Verrucomicrobiae bacterium]|nr:rhodanese-like domain-containing protein [Verrucomicrobiae bacterium]